MKKALIVWGGWVGHDPEEVASILGNLLREERFEVEISATLDSFADEEKLHGFDLIVPIWTGASLPHEKLEPLLKAVRSGVGIAGCHGGMADAFRTMAEYQYMVGGEWVAHPGGANVEYDVRYVDREHAITAGLTDYTIVSEKYYMHVDPAIHVLAVTNFDDTVMPVVWIKHYGEGRVFYNSLGHRAADIAMPETSEAMRRGMIWAAR